jgi:hypothetical protein
MSTAGSILSCAFISISAFWAVSAWLSNDRGVAVVVTLGLGTVGIVMLLVSLGVLT